MIVPMQKATVIVCQKDSAEAVIGVRRLGVLHVEHHCAPHGKDISQLQADSTLLDACFAVWSGAGIIKASGQQRAIDGDWKLRAHHIIDLGKRQEQLDTFSTGLAATVEEWKKWGDFDPQDIQRLAGKGIFVRLFHVPYKNISEFPAGAAVQVVSISDGVAYCVVVSREGFETRHKEIAPPHQGLQAMRRRLAEDLACIESFKKHIVESAEYYEAFCGLKQALSKEMELAQVIAGMGTEGILSYVTGYIPVDAVDKLQSYARAEKWGLLIEQPGDSDEVPTCLRNPRWVTLIEPVFKLLEIIPGYRELDVSVLFLVFFSIFFGMIIGDAGYGAVYMAITAFLHKKFAAKVRDHKAFYLFYLLSSAAIAWGLLTGTVFGQAWLAKAGFKALAPALNNSRFLWAFCFSLGAVHLSIGHAWRALVKMPSLAALADIGWICFVWAGFFLAKTLILNDPFPPYGLWLMYAGIVLNILFTSPQKNMFKAIGQGLLAFGQSVMTLSIIGNFTDVVSYIRLFAVGLAGVAIADTVNTLAASAGGNVVAGALILLVGHTLNVVLGPMSVLVHGVRLNILEFSVNHANVTWSGVSYKPLKE